MQERAKTAALAIGQFQPVASQHICEKFLGDVFGFMAVDPTRSHKNIDGTPVSPAKAVERWFGMIRGGQHQAPRGRRESAGLILRG